ncbi:MAG: mechanosensitive ion channel [Desulfobacterales bacterium]|nr:mechanosensitive ion channel [Desulfobacterales bacterium]
MELGLQESVTTITAYILWTFGILGALYAFGINPTSLAVLFGALGIGLGFGLQNIFNNFVSGLILLFERPIQVGDVVEVNGIWGKVNKINVRSTLVQTYDNASLIIPNSEFISSQLTNWSFKDSRIRRKITVGVAYGSDLSLVRQTLMEVAENHPRVLTEPQPDILFEDFGDSALVFTLRIWTLVDYALSTDTEIRLEIDRLFRKRNIQIPFPQRDIHLQSTSVQKNLDQAEKEINVSQTSILPATRGEDVKSTDQ